MGAGYLNRLLLAPWRRTDRLDCTETQLLNAQVWTQLHQHMFDLQAIAKYRGVPDTAAALFASPYPQ
jgi:hypothetical protein